MINNGRLFDGIDICLDSDDLLEDEIHSDIANFRDGLTWAYACIGYWKRVMGWASATPIFDTVAGSLLPCLNQVNRTMIKDTLKSLAMELENRDWDTQGESEHFEHPLVQEIFLELGTIREDGE